MENFKNIPNDVFSASSKEEVTIDGSENKEKFEEIKTIAQLLTESGSKIKVVYGKEPGWRYVFETNTIEICPEDMSKKSIEYCKGVVSHEAAHELISKVDFIPMEEWNEKGFSWLLNAIEDPRVNNWMSDRFAGPKQWLKKVYDEDYTCTKINDMAEEKIGYTPKHIQFGLEVIRYWHTGKFSDNLSDDVCEVLKKTIKVIESCSNLIPGKTFSSSEATRKAQLVYKLTRGCIWPEYKKLVDTSYENVALDEMIKEMLENGDFKLGNGEAGEGGTPIPMDQLSDEVKEKLKNKIKEKLEGMDSEKQKELKDKAKAAADKKIGELEDEANKKIEGHFGEQGEKKEKEKKSRSKQAIQNEIDRAMKEADEKIDEMRTDYERYILDLRQEIEDLTQFFLREFMSKRQPIKKPGSSGTDVNMAGGGPMKFKATGNYDELFLKTISHEKNDFRVTLLVDLSGSMSGDRVEETFKGLAMISEVLNNVGILFSIYGFQDDVFDFKTFKDKFDDKIRNKMMKMIDMAKGENSDGFCINEVYEKAVLQNLSKTNLFMIMSDGLPSGNNFYNSKNSCKEDLLEVIDKVRSNQEIDLIGFGIGPNTDHVKMFYEDNIQAKDIKDIPAKLKKKLKEKIVI